MYSWRVPSTVLGELKIAPSAYLGDMGPHRGEAVNYYWKWYHSASGLAMWPALILAIVVPRTNRDIRVLLILLPLVIVNILWWYFMKRVRMNSADACEITLIFHSMTVGVAVLWLMAKCFVRFGGAIRFLLSFGTVVIVAGLGPLSYFAEFSNETTMFLALFVFMALTMVVAITLSRRSCGGKYRPVCFMLWLALWTVAGGMFATFGFLIVTSTLMSSGPDIHRAILMYALAGLIFGLCLYILNLPFMILGFSSPFFRERFCACLRLKPAAATVTPSDGDNIAER